MTIAEGILLAVSIAVFIYLGIAMFRPSGSSRRHD